MEKVTSDVINYCGILGDGVEKTVIMLFPNMPDACCS